MDNKRRKEIVHELLSKYEKELSSEDLMEALIFVAVITHYNQGGKNPNAVLDSVIKCWVKCIAVLAHDFSSLPIGKA